MIRGASIIMLLWAFCFTIQGSLGQFYTSSYYRYPYASYYGGGGSYPSYNYQNYNGINGNGGYYNPGRYYSNYNRYNPIGYQLGGLNNFGSNGFLQSFGSPFGGNFGGGGGYYRKK